VVVELADLFERLLEVVVVLQPLTHLRHKFWAQGELAHATTGIGDGENIQRMALTAGALGAIAAMGTNAPMEERAAQEKEPLKRSWGVVPINRRV
jgi:hypothetical protein